MFLNYETIAGFFRQRGWRLGRLVEMPFAFVFFQRHGRLDAFATELAAGRFSAGRFDRKKPPARIRAYRGPPRMASCARLGSFAGSDAMNGRVLDVEGLDFRLSFKQRFQYVLHLGESFAAIALRVFFSAPEADGNEPILISFVF